MARPVLLLCRVSYPRRVVPGMTVMITRRALRRTHLLRPDGELNNLFVYCLAVFAARYGVAVHGVTVMSNHYHLVVTDTRGVLPDFLRELDRTLALALKVLRKWDGAAWDHEKPSVVELRTEQAVVEELAYVIGNPVAARAVRRAHQWPGLNIRPEQLGRVTWTATRPDYYCRPDNPRWPELATLQLTMPALAMADALVRTNVERELARIETEAHRAMQAEGRRFLGPEKVLAMSPYDRATSYEPLRSRNPTFAVGRGRREDFFEAVILLRSFRRAYRQALEAWRSGLRHVLFPAGTWHMRNEHRAMTAPS